MAQVTTGLRAILSAATIYELSQRLVGSRGMYRRLIRDFFNLRRGTRILDIGCGTGALLRELPADTDYQGFDASERYIAAARQHFGNRGSFWAEHVTESTIARVGRFDLAVAIGVLHHLDDDEARALFAIAAKAVGPGGRLVTYDCCFTEGQSAASRYLVSRDRGQNVRTPNAYMSLASEAFGTVESTVLDGHLRIPYTSVVLVCTAPRQSTQAGNRETEDHASS